MDKAIDQLKIFKFQTPRQLFQEIQLFSSLDSFIFDKRFAKAKEAWAMSRFCIGYEELFHPKCEVMMSNDESTDATLKVKL